MKTFEKEYIYYNNSQLVTISKWFRTHFIAVYRLLQIFQNFSPFGLRFQLRPNKSGLPLSSHLLCCRAFAVNYYSFTPCALQLRRNRQLQILGSTFQKPCHYKKQCGFCLKQLKIYSISTFMGRLEVEKRIKKTPNMVYKSYLVFYKGRYGRWKSYTAGRSNKEISNYEVFFVLF